MPANLKEDEAKPPRVAVVYLPGLGSDLTGDRALGIARRIERALDRTAATAAATFFTQTREEDYGDGRKIRVSEISRQKPGLQAGTTAHGQNPSPPNPPQPAVDVYHLDYRPLLRRRFERANLALKLLRLLIITIAGLVLVLRKLPAFGRWNALSIRDKLQLLYALAILALFFVCIGTLGVALFQQVVDLGADRTGGDTILATPAVIDPADNNIAAGAAAESAESTQERRVRSVLGAVKDALEPLWSLPVVVGRYAWAFLQVVWEDVLSPMTSPLWDRVGPRFSGGWSRTVLTVSALAALALADVQGRRQLVLDAGIDLAAATSYVNVGERRDVILGHLRDVLEHVAKQDPKYHSTHIVAYSFGSIITIDALFPLANPPSIRLAEVASLTTIGCPLDAIRLYWPHYFRGRCAAPGMTPARWVNVYSPIDVFSSNFRGDDKICPPDGKGVAGVEICQAPAPDQASLDDSCDCATESLRVPDISIPFLQMERHRKLRLADILTLLGFRAHAMYWELDDETEYSAFDEVVRRIFREGYAATSEAGNPPMWFLGEEDEANGDEDDAPPG